MKKNRVNYITSITMIIAFLATCLNGYSQDKKAKIEKADKKYELSIAVGGPFSFINYRTPQETVLGNGFSADIRYSYYLNEGLSVNLGVEYQTYSSATKSGFVTGQYAATDADNESFQFRYKAANFREEQKLGYVNIPVGIQFETSGKTKLYLGAGAKIGFAVNGTYETTIENLTTSGYYPQYNVELFNPAFAGFGNTANINTGKQDLSTEISYSATIEAGVKQSIGSNKSIYIGLYLDYGLNNIYEKQSKNVVQYNPEIPVALSYNTVLNSAYDDVKLLSYGLKLRFALR